MITWEDIDKFGTLLGIGATIIAAWQSYSLRKETRRRWEKANEKITIILRSHTEEMLLDFTVKRGDLNRAELLGIIGMLPLKNAKPNERFAPIKFTASSAFMEKINQIRDSDSIYECIVVCEPTELDQFDCLKTPIQPSIAP